ncbi:hypothetical protein ABH935_001152 [Catenulispora sp. GAS73]
MFFSFVVGQAHEAEDQQDERGQDRAPAVDLAEVVVGGGQELGS